MVNFLGGDRVVAKMLGTTAKAVANWRYFAEFPANTYIALQTALKARKATAPDYLWAMRPLKKVS